MKISWNWLNDYIDLQDYKIEDIADILTSIGLEVEKIEEFESLKGGLKNFYIGEVLECSKHPNADKLSLTKVDLGTDLGIKNIVCGAPNVAKGQKVVVAIEGAVVYLSAGENFTIKNSKIRGEESQGMICAEDELGLGTNHDGILVLDHDVKIGIPAAAYFKISSDYVLEIGLTPNRTDAMSHRGVARDLYAAMNIRNLPCEYYPKGKNFTENKIPKSDKTINIDTKTAKTPRFGGLILEHIENNASPDWMKNRLKSIGESPKNILIDITNYILHDLGQPLHAYDVSKIQGYEIYADEQKTDTHFTTLTGQEVKLKVGDVIIRDSKNILGIAGVMGSKDSAVSEQTNTIFLEAAYFHPTAIRQTAQRLNLRTEAAMKFEKGIDPTGLEYALEKAKNMLYELCPTILASEIKISSNQDFEYWKTHLSQKKLNMYANTDIPVDKIDSILKNLGIKIISFEKEVWQLEIPRFKEDVKREEDVIEDVLRIYGFNNLPYPKYLKSNLSFTNGISTTKFELELASFLSGRGLKEIITNSISQSRYYKNEQPIKLLNSMTSELDCMRSSMIPSILEVIEYNINHDQKDLSFFEIGNEYSMDEKGKYSQKKKICIALTGMNESPNWQKAKGSANDYFQLKSLLESLFEKLKFPILYNESQNSDLHYGLDIILNQKTIGFLGDWKVDKALFDIKQSVLIAELDFNAMHKWITKSKTLFTEISKFPTVKRDLAMIVADDISFNQIETLSKKTIGKNLIDMGLFDIFKASSLGENKKSYAIRFHLQNSEKTMSDKEIDQIMQKLIYRLNEDLKAEIRS